MSKDVELGDIVLVNEEGGTQHPAIVVRVDSPTSIVVYHFTVGGSGGGSEPIEMGTAPGQWQPKK